MLPPLEEILRLSVDEVKHRERHALEDLLATREKRVVLFGSGTLGHRALELLTGIGAHVLAFSDNNESKWGSSVDGVPVLSPREASAQYGRSAVFLVTIWNDRHWYAETKAQLTELGCDSICTYAPIFWKFQDTFLTLLLLNEPPHRLFEDTRRVLSAETLWADEESLHIYRANIVWRALGDASYLPGRPDTFTYFPKELFSLREHDKYLDCGAFDGDTIREILASCPQGTASMYAIEADTISFDQLSGFIEKLPRAVGDKIHALQLAIGKERCQLRFECSGSLTSKASEDGVLVECFTIDELFQNKPLSIIKMDIEGAEFDAILGARKVMERDQPILAICVYHTQNDIWRIPLLIREMLPQHRLYLRAYEGDGFQTVCFAVPPEREAKRIEFFMNASRESQDGSLHA